MKRKFIPMSLGLVLCGCMQYSEITTPPEKVSFTDQSVASAVTGFGKVAVRTLSSTKKGTSDDQEIIGGICQITGKGFRAEVTTPAAVEMPKFKGSADPVTLSCRVQGSQKARVITPINRTLENLRNAQVSGPLAAVLIGAAIKGLATGTRDPLKDEYAYPAAMSVVFGTEN